MKKPTIAAAALLPMLAAWLLAASPQDSTDKPQKPRPATKAPAIRRPVVGRGPIGPGRIPRPGRGGPAKPFDQWNQAELVFVAKLTQVDVGPVARSLPPIHTHKLHLQVKESFRGDLEAKKTVIASHAARQSRPPTFPEGKLCVVAAARSRGTLRVLGIKAGDEKTLREIKLSCALPLGWKTADGKPLSPWAGLPGKWPEAARLPAEHHCSKTGRPALLAGGSVKFTVEKIPPVKQIKWTNPDGDGEYKITLTNPTKNPLQVPALLTAGKKVLWAESLVILCQGRAYACPGAKPLAGPLQPLTLKPGASVTTVVNALRLEGPKWPRGGSRVEFQFCLGEKSQTLSFYYLSRHHDEVRKKLRTL